MEATWICFYTQRQRTDGIVSGTRFVTPAVAFVKSRLLPLSRHVRTTDIFEYVFILRYLIEDTREKQQDISNLYDIVQEKQKKKMFFFSNFNKIYIRCQWSQYQLYQNMCVVNLRKKKCLIFLKCSFLIFPRTIVKLGMSCCCPRIFNLVLIQNATW